MSKVNYRKSHITEFIDQKEREALGAVKNNHKTMYQATLCSTIGEIPGLNVIISDVQDQLQKLEINFNAIKEQSQAALEFKHGYSYLGHEGEFKKYDPLFMIQNKMSDKKGVLKSILNSENHQIEAVREEYAKVKSQINRMTKPVEMRKYLETLGFDMSFLDKYTCENIITVETIQEIDKRNLFPYKELPVLNDEVK